jgi:acyl-coenzyme A synthetase/AMP-(fatty) acid ligase
VSAPRHTVVFGGFATATAVRERLNVSRAKALIVADAARRKGKLIPVKQQVDEVISDLRDLEMVVVVLRGQLSKRLAPRSAARPRAAWRTVVRWRWRRFSVRVVLLVHSCLLAEGLALVQDPQRPRGALSVGCG